MSMRAREITARQHPAHRFTVQAFAHQLDFRAAAEQRHQPLSSRRLVVDDQDADGDARLLLRRSFS
jgi:hypothetical protein